MEHTSPSRSPSLAPAADGGAGIVAEVLAGLTTAVGRADPYPLYKRLRALGPAAAGPDGTLVVTGYPALSALLRDHRLRKAPGRMLVASGYPDWRERPSLRLMFTSILLLNPPAHTRLRRLVSAVFTARRVERLRPPVERIVAQACDRLESESDFITGFAFPVPVTVIGELLGIPAADRGMFQDLARDWTAVLDDLSPPVVDRADAAAATIGGYLSGLARYRAGHPADDLISALAAASAASAASDADGRLSEEELVTMAALLLAAGFETTTGLLSNGLVALLAHPDQAARLRGEPELAGPAIEELLRYDSPVQMLFGRSVPDSSVPDSSVPDNSAPEGIDVGGIALAAGQRVLALLGAGNRDPAVFGDPDRLILDRREQAPLSFGGGIHYCLGAPLARLEAQVAFPALLSRFPHLALAGDSVGRSGLALHGHTSLLVSVR